MDAADYIALLGLFLLSGGVFLEFGGPAVAVVDGAILLIVGVVLGFVRGAKTNGATRKPVP